MKTIAVFALLAAGLWLIAGGVAQSQQITFVATLGGFEEVPSVSTNGTGTLRVTVLTGTLNYELSYDNLSATVTQAHIHFGKPSDSGGVIAFLCGGGDKPACPTPGGTVTGTIDMADIIGPAGQGIAAGEFAEARRALTRGLTYCNVHSEAFPGGEIRGQLLRGN